MTDTVRDAIYTLNLTVAGSTGATMYQYWPDTMPKRSGLPAVMIAKGEERHNKKGTTIWNELTYRLVIFYIDADKQSRSYAENQRILIVPLLVSLYMSQTDDILTLSGTACDQADILTVTPGITATEVYIDKLYGNEYFISEISIPIRTVT